MKRADLIAYSAAVTVIAAVLSMSIPGSAFGKQFTRSNPRLTGVVRMMMPLAMADPDGMEDLGNSPIVISDKTSRRNTRRLGGDAEPSGTQERIIKPTVVSKERVLGSVEGRERLGPVLRVVGNPTEGVRIPRPSRQNNLAERSGRGGVEGANTEWPLMDTQVLANMTTARPIGCAVVTAHIKLHRVPGGCQSAGANPALVLKFLELPRAWTVAQTPVFKRQSQINSTTQGRRNPYENQTQISTSRPKSRQCSPQPGNMG